MSRHAPKEPAYSCPNIDAAQAEMEKAREIHDDLRKWGQYYETLAEELQTQIDDTIEERNRKYREYENTIENLQATIQELTNNN